MLAGHIEEAVGEFERAGIEAQHRGFLKDALRVFALAVKTAKAAINDPTYVRDRSSDEDYLERTAARCRRRAKTVRLKIQRDGGSL